MKKPWPHGRQRQQGPAAAFAIFPRTERPCGRRTSTATTVGRTRPSSLHPLGFPPSAASSPFPHSSASAGAVPASASVVASLPALFPARPPAVAASLSIAVFVSGLLLGFVLGKKFQRHRKEPNENDCVPGQQRDEEAAFTSTSTATNPTWFNYALAQLWKLLAANTRQFVDQVLQPLLDEAVLEKMNNADDADDADGSSLLLDRIRLTQYNLGARTAPTVFDLRAIPARSRAELQCRYNLRLRSTSDLEFAVDVRVLPPLLARPEVLVNQWWHWWAGWWRWLWNKCLPWKNVTKRGSSTKPRADNNDYDIHHHHQNNSNATVVTIPVSLSNLQIDAQLWSAFELRPFEPYCTAWRYAVLEPPAVDFEMTVGNGTSLFTSLPVTSIPLLRSVFFRIIREEIPKDCLFPKSNTVHFLPKDTVKARQKILNANATTRDDDDDDDDVNSNLTEGEIRDAFPEQAALFDALDVSEDGRLRKSELVRGLQHWGYTPQDARASFAKLEELQQQQQQVVQSNKTQSQTVNTTSSGQYIALADFCRLWPQVTADPIPAEYEGMLMVRLENLTMPTTTTNDSSTAMSNTLQSPVLQARLLGDGDPVDGGYVRPGQTVNNGDPASGDNGSTLWVFVDANDESSTSNVPLELPCRPLALERLELTLYDDDDDENDDDDDDDDQTTLPFPLLVREDTSNKNRTRNIIAQATIPLKSLAAQATDQQTVQVNMEPAGKIALILSYAKFVDRWDVCSGQDETAIVDSSTNSSGDDNDRASSGDDDDSSSSGHDNGRANSMRKIFGLSENRVDVAEDKAGKGTSG